MEGVRIEAGAISEKSGGLDRQQRRERGVACKWEKTEVALGWRRERIITDSFQFSFEGGLFQFHSIDCNFLYSFFIYFVQLKAVWQQAPSVLLE